MSDINEKASSDDNKKKIKTNQPDLDQRRSIVSSLEYLTALGIENGWQVAPGWYAPLCDEYVNDCLKDYKYSGLNRKKKDDDNKKESSENDMFIEEIYDLRHRAILLIDRILEKPLSSSSDNSDDPLQCVYYAVNNVLGNNDGARLINLLCPMSGGDVSQDNPDTPNTYRPNNGNVLQLKPSFFEQSSPMRWIQGFLYSLACCRSGVETYSQSKKDCNWQPNQWQYDDNQQKVPYNKIRQGRGIAGDGMVAKTEDSWKEDGISFGAGQISIYNKSEIK